MEARACETDGIRRYYFACLSRRVSDDGRRIYAYERESALLCISLGVKKGYRALECVRLRQRLHACCDGSYLG